MAVEISRKRSFVSEGLQLGQIMVLDESFRGIGKTELIHEMARLLQIPVVVSSDRCARHHEGRFTDGVRYISIYSIVNKIDGVKGYRNVFVDEITTGEYDILKNTLRIKIAGGIIKK